MTSIIEAKRKFAARGDNRLSVVLVDDDADDCEFTRMHLRQSPFVGSVHVYQCAEDMLRTLSRNTALMPSILILDLHMPLLCGIGTLDYIRNHTQDWGHIPTIFLSGVRDPYHKIESPLDEYTTFMAKPFDLHQFESILGDYNLALHTDRQF